MTYAIFGLLTVILIVFCVLAAKTWHWLNIVLMILCWAAGLTAVYGFSQSYKLRRAGLKTLKQAEERFARADLEFNEALNGPADSLTYGSDSLRGVNELVSLEFSGRGRVWPNGAVAPGAGGSKVFTFKTARTELDANNQIRGVILFAFADTIVDGVPYPASYVATVEVTEEQLGTASLDPVFIANQHLVNQTEGVTWSLFEKMPADRRDTFKRKAGLPSDYFADTGDALNQKITDYRKLLVEEFLPAGVIGLDPESEEYETFIDRYCFDGLGIGQIANWVEKNSADRKTEFAPEAEEVFVRYEFTANSEPIAVDAEGDIAVEGVFTQGGLAVDPALHAGQDVKFVEGDVIVIDQLTANGYRRGDNTQDRFDSRYPVNEIGRVYQRQLRDYPYMLEEYQTQAQVFEKDTQLVVENIKVTNEAVANTEAQTQSRQTAIDALRADSDALKRDAEAINGLSSGSQAELAELKSKKETLTQSNDSLYKKVKAIAFTLAKYAKGVAGSR